MTRFCMLLLVLIITFIVAESVISQDAYAAAEKKPDAVITAEKPSATKIWFGVGMLVAGILAVKYL